MTEQTNSAEKRTDRKLQIAKKKSALIFAGYIAGEGVFRLKTHKGGVKKCVLQQDICTVDDEKRYRLTEEQVQRFKDAEAEFQRDYRAAKRGEDGFFCALKDGETRYARRLPDWRYQFIAERPNGDVVQLRESIVGYLHLYDSDIDLFFPDWRGDGRRPDIDEWRRNRERYRLREEEILLQMKDEYLTGEIKYLNDYAAREEVTFLTQSDGKQRFFKSKEVYGTEDIAVCGIRRILPTFFNRSEKYWLTIRAEGGVYGALYYPRCSYVDVHSEGKVTRCIVTEEMRDRIDGQIKSGGLQTQTLIQAIMESER